MRIAVKGEFIDTRTVYPICDFVLSRLMSLDEQQGQLEAAETRIRRVARALGVFIDFFAEKERLGGAELYELLNLMEIRSGGIEVLKDGEILQ